MLFDKKESEMSMNDMLVIQFNDREAVLRKADGTFVRRFTARNGTSIVQASVSNAGDDSMVTLNYANGHADIYYWHGTIYRSL